MDSQDQFDSTLNTDYHSLYDNRSDIVSDVIGGTAAAVADFAGTTWNSLTPVDMNTDTRDLVSSFGDNALRVYDEHPDAVSAASFIAGTAVPAGLTSKALKLLRSGEKGWSWFTEAGRVQKLTEMDNLFQGGMSASAEYRTARNAFLARNVGNQFLDAAAIEGSIMLAQNQHPYMEDYMKDPVNNFLLWGTIGGVLGAGVGLAADNYLLKSMAGKSESAAFDTATRNLSTYQEGIPTLDKLKVHQVNIDTLESLLGSASDVGPIKPNQLVTDIAKNLLLNEQARAQKIYDGFAKNLGTLEKTDQVAIMNRLVKDLNLSSVDSVEFLKVAEDGQVKTLNKFKPVSEVPTDFASQMEWKVNKNKITPKILYPNGVVGSTKDAFWYAPAAAIDGITESSVGKLGKNFLLVPNVDQGLLLTSKSSAEVDKAWLDSLKAVDQIELKKGMQIAIDPQDLPTIQALIAKAQKDHEVFDNVKFIVTSELPDYTKYTNNVLKEGGVDVNHIKTIDNMMNASMNIRADKTLSEDAKNFIDTWTAGTSHGKHAVRIAFDSFFRDTSVSVQKHLAAEIYKSPTANRFRSELSKIADKDGNIYLYRGLERSPKGTAAVESYSTSKDSAGAFGDIRLFKIPVEDVIGHVDYNGEREILVGSASRQEISMLPIRHLQTTIVKNTIQLPELAQLLAKGKQELLNHLASQGLPKEAIALRTNIPVETVDLYLHSGVKDLVDLERSWMSYTDAGAIKDYLSPQNKPLVLKANINKVPYADFVAKLQQNTNFNINQQLIESFLVGSKSAIARKIQENFFGDYKYLLGFLRTEVSNAVNQKAGWRFFTSSDFYSRDMGNFGIIANNIGKRIQHIANEAETALIKPFTQDMTEVAKDITARIEANTAFQLNAGLKGPRYYRNRQFWQEGKVINAEGKEVASLIPVDYQGKEFKIVNDSVDSLLKNLETSGRELYNLKNTINKILGKPDLTDLGFWVPAFDPRDKFIAYVWNKSTDQTQLLWGNSEAELLKARKAYEGAFADRIAKDQIQIVTKQDQELYNILNGRLDPLTMSIANVEKLHGGSSATAIVRSNVDVFREITGGYQHYTNSHIRNLLELIMHDITDILDRMSLVNQAATKNQPLGEIKKAVFKSKDAAKEMKNILLGNDSRAEVPGWQKLNQSFETGINMGLNTLAAAWKAVQPSKWAKSKEINYEDLVKELSAKGINNPYEIFDSAAADIFKVSQLSESKNTSKRLINISNALAATVALRFGELAQPIVNAMSLPILSMGAIAGKMPASFLGVTKATAININPVSIMYNGMRAAHSNLKEWQSLDATWTKLGYYDPFVSEAQKVLSEARKFEPGAIAKVENALDSNLVKWMSKPADASEALVRRITMFTGAYLAKRLYPELDEAGITIFARHFMDQAVGNYHAAQRPTMFQGTLGVAMGLFQTYMLTMAQSMYRHIELKNFKALGKMMLTQAGIFGAKSLPGFDIISKQIGEHFSDQNVDLTTGTYRALGDSLASLVLYGLPSNMGPAFYSRGEIQPRVPTGVGEFPTVNFLAQTVTSLGQVRDSLQRDYPDLGRGFSEALSMQSMSRPLARAAELAQGYSVTRQGNTVAVPEEVWTATSVISRILGTRPLEEAKLRDAISLDRYYTSLDHDARSKSIESLKEAIRGGSLTDSKLSSIAEEYMRTGTPQGWRSAVNTALAQTEISGRASLIKKLKPDSPLNYMINGLDG